MTDNANNTTSCTQLVTVHDSTIPEIVCCDDVTIDAMEGQCKSGPVEYMLPAVFDRCTTDPADLVLTFDPPQGTMFDIGEHTVTITVTDPSDNSATCTFKVIVKDVTPPSLTCPGNMIIDNTRGQCGAANVTFDINATDDCSGPVTVVTDPPSGSTFPSGPTIVHVTATDTAGNSAQCSFLVTVNDTELPTIQCPPAIDVLADPGTCQAAEIALGTPTVSDNCSTPVLTGQRSDGQPLNAPYPVGVTTVTWTVTDSSYNMATCDQTVTVHDTTAPTITCPDDIMVNAPQGQCQSGPVNYTALGVADNCSTSAQSVVVTFDPPSGSQFPIGVTSVTATATDAAGNTAQCSFNVTVNDTTPPVITCLGNITINSDADSCGASAVNYEVTATDSCSLPVTVVTTPPSGSSFPVGVTQVTATATDAADNVSTCTFTVTVVDNQPPTVQCPPMMVVNNSPGECQALNVTYTAEASDNCEGPVNVMFTPPSGSNLPVGNNTILVKATDQAGNMATCSFLVVVLDKDAPRIECPDGITVMTVPCETDAVVQLTTPQAQDQCGAVTVNGFRSDGRPLTDRFPIGPTTITWIAIDSHGQTATCTQLIQVQESECAPVCDDPPTIVCGMQIKLTTLPCQPEAFTTLIPPVSVSECGPNVVTGMRVDGRPLTDGYPIGDNYVVWTATDPQDRQASCSQSVWVDGGECAPACDGADLVVMAKMLPMYKNKGKKSPTAIVSGWWVVTNIGTQTSPETSVCFYLSDDQVLDAGDFQFKPNKKHHKVNSLRPGEMDGVDLKAKGPKGVNIEGKYILAVVDCPGLVTECREDNNTTANVPTLQVKGKKK